MKIAKSTLEAVTPAASTDATRYNLNGVHVAGDGEHLTLTATDGHRLHRVAQPECGRLEPATLELAPLTTARKALGAKEALEVDIAASNANGAVTLENAHGARFAVPKLEGSYPDVEQVLPKDEPWATVRLNARYLRDVADAALRAAPRTVRKVGGREDQREKAPTFVDVDIFDVLSPVRFTAEGDDGREFVAVVMPVRK